MKTLLLLVTLLAVLQSCTVIRISNSFNSTTDCSRIENVCFSEDGIEIRVQGNCTDYKLFLASGMDKNILLNKGYRMDNSQDNFITFTAANYY